MTLTQIPKRHRFPVSIISQDVWLYQRFNNSYRDIQEQLAFQGIDVSHEAIRSWCLKFSRHFKDVIQKRERKPNDKWHLDEMTIKMNDQLYVLWRAIQTSIVDIDSPKNPFSISSSKSATQ